MRVIFGAQLWSSVQIFLTGDVTFDTSIINVGNGMDIQSGYFTAPTRGYYYFSFSGTAYDLEGL